MTTTDLFTPLRSRVEHTLKTAIMTRKHGPEVLRDAMLYSTLNGGKRLRPILVYITAAALNTPPEQVDTIAAAIECIHCFSLIHDDLPAMDDDKLRRNKPTCHIVFSEAIAILAGDALQTLAFELLSAPQQTISIENQLKIIALLSQHTGFTGMTGGQSLDLLAENKTSSAAEIEHIHLLKTGALIRASVLMGALGAGCSDTALLAQLDTFATQLGIAFQLQDDLLDVTQTQKNLGKTAGKDSAQHKSTYALSMGIEATRARIDTVMQDARMILKELPVDTEGLIQLCDMTIVGRPG
jgi:farnesyl diphosphate synthase